ncbi:dnaJ homolog subfamily C member 14 [Pelobates cultripes]|uniref:DnaJ homolog subfamily C member 14 n=1 Tax=Pelobates cultripes TaxID=61616 RepID=A0AAD1R5F1_PELCU|nr:dnaJ homolog subfamily C member 14 [Pelobates cultripes]
MEKQIQGGIEKSASSQHCNEGMEERNGTYFSVPGNCYSAKHNLKASSEQNGTGLTTGRFGNHTFFVPKHTDFPNLNLGKEQQTHEHFVKEDDVWTKEFLSEERLENVLASELNDRFECQLMPETTQCTHSESLPPFKLECGCVTDNTGSSGGTYSDIADHSCRRGCHPFSSYQQRPLDGEGVEDGVLGKQMEADEDSIKVAGGRRGARKGRTRVNLKEDSRRDGRQHTFSGSKHKLGRKKSHGDGRSILKSIIPQPLILLSTTCVQLLIDLVLLIGKYVEMFGTRLYTSVLLPASDLGLLKIQLQTFGVWARHRVKDSWHMICSFGLWLLRVLKMLCALLFLLLMLAVGCARLCWQYIKRAAERVGGHNNCASCISVRLRRIWALITQNRTFSRLVSPLRKLKSRLWRLRVEKETSWATAGSPTTGRYQPGEEVERLLTMADIPEEELNPFQVLGVEINASETELKKAYRQLAVLVHPDKNNHPRAEEAFKILRAAWDTVSNPEKRREYEMKRMSETELAKSMNEFLTKLQDDLKEAMNSMMCSKCQGKHRRFEMDRDPTNARYCAECGKMHPAEEGDFWAESSMLGLKITYFAMMQGKVFDITEWAGCQRVGISPDTHRVPYHISFGSRNPTSTGRQRAPSENGPSSVADLQNLLSRIFQGSPGQMPNRNVFNTPQGAQSPSGPVKPDSAPRSDTKAKRKKKVRRPLQK